MVRYCIVAFSAVVMGACGRDDDPGRPTTIQVEGQVISSRSRAAVPDAIVRIGNVLGDDFVVTTTDSDGRFTATVEYFACEGSGSWWITPTTCS